MTTNEKLNLLRRLVCDAVSLCDELKVPLAGNYLLQGLEVAEERLGAGNAPRAASDFNLRSGPKP